LNLIRIMPVEENFSLRPSVTGRLFLFKEFKGSAFRVQGSKVQGLNTGLIRFIGLFGSMGSVVANQFNQCNK